MTRVPGLFAAGECAAGLHGANRLGGNSLSDLLVFGKRAGQYAARYAKDVSATPVDSKQVEEIATAAVAPFERQAKSSNAFTLQSRLQEMMQDLVGIVRTGNELESALMNIRVLQQEAQAVFAEGNRAYNPGWHTALELPHMLTVAEAIARAALERKESRGGHFREDYAEKSDFFGNVNTSITRNAEGQMEVKTVPKEKMRNDLQAIVDEMK
jgi:succinate dehydrogenase / fumarate reductase flavoprotein subunit